MPRRLRKKKIANRCQPDLVLVIRGGRASLQVADLTVLVSNNERPLKLQHEGLRD